MGLQRSWLVSLILSAGFASHGTVAQVPPRSEAGQTLQVAEEELDRGFLYYARPGEDAQLVITTAALLQRIAVVANRVVGHLLIPFDVEEVETPVLGGAFRLPLASLSTGSLQMDEMLRGKEFLDVSSHPEVGFVIQEIGDVKRETGEQGFETYRLTLIGDLYVKGQAHSLTLQSRLRLMPFTMRTLARDVGDLALLETSFSVRFADLGWTPPERLRDRLGEQVSVDVFLMLNTVSPDKSIDPRDDPAIYVQQLRFATFLRDLADAEAAYTLGKQLMTKIWDDSKELNRLATTVLDSSSVQRNLSFAQKAANRASQLTKEGDPTILATRARLHFEMSELEAAVQWQQRALEAASGEPEQQLKTLKQTLERYQRAMALSAGDRAH